MREDWRKSARDFLAAGADLIDSLLERARAAAAAIRARSPPWSTSPWRPSPPPATVFVVNKDGCFHRRHLLAEARRHLALVQRGRRREPCLDEKIVDTALAAHCTDITEARTERGEEPGYRLYTARWAPAAPPRSRTPAAAVSGRDRKSTAPAAPFVPLKPGEWAIPRVPLRPGRALIAARVLTAQMRTATVDAPYRLGDLLYRPRGYGVSTTMRTVARYWCAPASTTLRPAGADLAGRGHELLRAGLTDTRRVPVLDASQFGVTIGAEGDDAGVRVDTDLSDPVLPERHGLASHLLENELADVLELHERRLRASLRSLELVRREADRFDFLLHAYHQDVGRETDL
ncbi:hypothetical protein [Streptomyces swartbergensis]|uniref:hypothetical protein n=1 Tax=Streptomyces swartbergensis TaxID=487165 RepID=UPI003827EB64